VLRLTGNSAPRAIALLAAVMALSGACQWQADSAPKDADPKKGSSAAEGQEKDAEAKPAEPAVEVATAPANGWGEDIAWRSLDDGMATAKQTDRPMMLIVWTSWCPKCRALKQKFAENGEVQELSKQFVMVNVDQDELPEVSKHGPDGDYIPRLMFFDADGEIDDAVLNTKRRRARYFYSPVDDVAAKMREALERHAARS
jgi:protein-disulfide reductase (glutathione)